MIKVLSQTDKVPLLKVILISIIGFTRKEELNMKPRKFNSLKKFKKDETVFNH